MFHVQEIPDTLQESVHIMKTSMRLAQRSFKLPRGGPEKQDTCPKDPSLELTTKVASYPGVASTMEMGPTMRWVGSRDNSGRDARRMQIFSTG